ncbi:MAG: LacI family DNA-binding transcriptional regulator [Propionivibrio sp.]
MKPTLRDIAKAVGVSPATVSLVLREKGNISPDTRDQVLKAAAELGYLRPDTEGARADKPRKTLGLLLVIDQSFSYMFYFISKIIESLEKRVREDGYDVVLIPISFQSTDAEIVMKVMDARVKAVASLHYANINAFVRLEDRDIPVVVVMNNKHLQNYYSVCSDDFHGAYEGTKYLIELGHRSLAYIGGDRFNLEALLRERFMGFMSAISEFRLEFDPSLQVNADTQDMAILRKEVAALFDRPNPPTALFVLDDELALRVHMVLAERGLRVPEDVSIIAPGDVLDYTKPYIPQFTTMRINTDVIGSTTGEFLMNRLRHAKQKLYGLKVNQELVDRGSCAPLNRQGSEMATPEETRTARVAETLAAR